MPPRANVAQQKGWEKPKASQGQNPQARMTLGMETVQDSQNLDHAVWNLLLAPSIPSTLVIPHTQPSPPTGRTNKEMDLSALPLRTL